MNSLPLIAAARHEEGQSDERDKSTANLAVEGKTQLAVQDVESHPHYLDEKDRTETIEGIKRGLESMKQRRGKPATEFFREFFVEKGITHRE